MAHLYILAASITGKKSVIDAPFSYSHHQRVIGLVFDAFVILAFITWGLIVAYRNFGTAAKRRAGAAGE